MLYSCRRRRLLDKSGENGDRLNHRFTSLIPQSMCHKIRVIGFGRNMEMAAVDQRMARKLKSLHQIVFYSWKTNSRSGRRTANCWWHKTKQICNRFFSFGLSLQYPFKESGTAIAADPWLERRIGFALGFDQSD